MNSGHDTSGSTGHEADRRFLLWLRAASPAELRAMGAIQARTYCPQWEAEALARELRRRAQGPDTVPCGACAGSGRKVVEYPGEDNARADLVRVPCGRCSGTGVRS